MSWLGCARENLAEESVAFCAQVLLYAALDLRCLLMPSLPLHRDAQVELLSSQPVRCPITLEDVGPAQCPQITPCGHVFSFPAIVGHLAAHGDGELRKSAPCPLCYTPVR